MKTLFKEDNEVKEKVILCEALVQKKFMNIIKIETEVNDLRTIIKSKDVIEEAASNMKPISEKTECKSTHEKNVKEEVKKKNDKQNNDIKCEMCKCSCKKIKIMRKHMNMKHTDNECKICDNVFTNSMDALVHTAKEHSQNITEDNPNMNVQLEKINEIPEVKENIDKASKLKQLKLGPAARTALHPVCGCVKTILVEFSQSHAVSDGKYTDMKKVFVGWP